MHIFSLAVCLQEADTDNVFRAIASRLVVNCI